MQFDFGGLILKSEEYLGRRPTRLIFILIVLGIAAWALRLIFDLVGPAARVVVDFAAALLSGVGLIGAIERVWSAPDWSAIIWWVLQVAIVLAFFFMVFTVRARAAKTFGGIAERSEASLKEAEEALAHFKAATSEWTAHHADLEATLKVELLAEIKKLGQVEDRLVRKIEQNYEEMVDLFSRIKAIEDSLGIQPPLGVRPFGRAKPV